MAIVVERTTPKVDSTGASGTAFFTGSPTVGNRIIVAALGYSGGGEQTLTVNDDATGGSNSYSVDRHQYSGGTNNTDIASAPIDRTKSGLGVTATYSSGFICFAAMEVSGLASSNPVDKAVGATDATSPFEVSTGALAQADEIVVGAFSFAATSSSTHGIALTTWGGLNPDTLYVNDGPSINSEYGAAGYKIVASTASVTVGFSANNDGDGGNVVAAATYKAAAASPQFLRPSSDVSTGAWQPNPSSPATLYDKLDEASFDDADYIFTTTSATTCEVALSAPSGTPGSGSRIVRWRSPSGYSPNGGITVTLMQGTTQIAQWVTPSITAGTTYTHTLSQAEADSITDYTDLRIRLTSS